MPEGDPAPVYRHVDAASTLLGLEVHTELPLCLLAGFAALRLLPFAPGLALTAGLYVALRLLSHGRPPGHLARILRWHAVQARAGGVHRPGGRPVPEFPFAPHREDS